jgi:hypothetical protein
MKSKRIKKDSQSEIGFYLRVLGYQESDRIWAAHCLETDLVGYGRTFKKALDSLYELTEMQISFAQYKNQPALLDHSAPVEIFEIYNTLLRANLQKFSRQSKIDRKRRITSIPFPSNLEAMSFAIVPA